jgi:nickel transport protein
VNLGTRFSEWKNQAPFVCATAAILLVLLSSQAQAHKVNVFAYVEGDRVVVEGYFGGNVKALDSPVEVFDEAGKKIHEGKTDDKGVYSFKFSDLQPFSGGLKIVLEAGMGHKADYTLSASDIPGSLKKDASVTEQAPKYKAEEGSAPTTVATAIPALDQAALEKAIEEALDKKLEPVVRMLGKQEKLLLEQKYGGPKLTDIVGGIGWIVGIFGIAAFFLGRNRPAKK